MDFFDALFEGMEGYVEFRSFPPDGDGKPQQKFVELPLKELPKLSETRHQYFGPAPRKQKRGTDDSVSETRCLWADVDAKCFEGGKEEAYKTVSDLGPLTPSIIVDTGNGYHAYWLLEEPMGKHEARDWMESLRFAISPKLDNVSNPSRILRVPGTQNLKNNDPKLVKIIDFEPDRLFNSEIFEQYTVKPSKKPKIPQKQIDDIDPVTMALEGTIPKSGRGTPFDGRNDAAARVAGYFLSGNDEQRAFSFLRDWNQVHCDPPLDTREVESIFESILKREKSKRGEVTGERSLDIQTVAEQLGIPLQDIARTTGDDPKFIFFFGDFGNVMLSLQDAVTQNNFHKAIFSATGKMPKKISSKSKGPKWEDYLERFYNLATVRDLGEEATLKGELKNWVREYLISYHPRKTTETVDPQSINEPRVKDGDTYIRPQHLKKFLQDTFRVTKNQNDLVANMNIVGFERETIGVQEENGWTTRSFQKVPDGFVD
jgi:hypothetical protein